MKLQQIGTGSYFVTLPMAIIKAKGWEKGQKIRYRISDKGEIILYG